MKILIMIPVWKRATIFKEIAARLQGHKVVAILSEEDPQYYEQIRTCNVLNIDFFHAPNSPVGRKMNIAIDKVMRNFDFDYLMGLNSDNIIHEKYWWEIREPMREGYPMIGMNQVIALERFTRRAIKLNLTQDDVCKVWGGGRLISRDALHRTFVKVGHWYPDTQNSGLDTGSQRVIFENVMLEKPIKVIDGCYLVDLKTEDNINTFDSLHSVPQEAVDYEEVIKEYKI